MLIREINEGWDSAAEYQMEPPHSIASSEQVRTPLGGRTARWPYVRPRRVSSLTGRLLIRVQPGTPDHGRICTLCSVTYAIRVHIPHNVPRIYRTLYRRSAVRPSSPAAIVNS